MYQINCQLTVIHVMNVNYILTDVFGGPLMVIYKLLARVNPVFLKSNSILCRTW